MRIPDVKRSQNPSLGAALYGRLGTGGISSTGVRGHGSPCKPISTRGGFDKCACKTPRGSKYPTMNVFAPKFYTYCSFWDLTP